MDKKLFLFLILMTLIFEILFLDFLAIRYVFEPAYISTQIFCNKDFKTDWVIVGTFTPSTNKIEVNQGIPENSLAYRKILAHELKHLQQLRENRLWACDGFLNLGVFQNEVQAKSEELFITIK